MRMLMPMVNFILMIKKVQEIYVLHYIMIINECTIKVQEVV
jgi:hypothetical protein